MGLQKYARFGSLHTSPGITSVYDAFGRLRESTSTMDGTARVVQTDYESYGLLKRIRYPGGPFFEYQYATDGNLFLVTENGSSTQLAQMTYNAFGWRTRIDRDLSGAGAFTQFEPDPISRLRSMVHNLDGSSGVNDLAIGFSYNPASQIAARTQTNDLYEFPIPTESRTYTSNGRNQYTQIAGTGAGTPTYDLNGNLTSDGATSPTNYTYDTENRLTGVSGAKSATLTYDPLGRLYQATAGGTTTRFVYDGDRLIAEYNTSGTALRRYVHGAGVDEPLVWYEGSTVSSANRRYLHANHQGSIIATSNAAGAKLDIGTYDAYGNTTAPSTWRFQYTGQTTIPALGLYYYKARFYNPALGRFMQTDPVGYQDDLNLYAYVYNDPLNRTDPTGLDGIQPNTCSRLGSTHCSGGGPPKPGDNERPKAKPKASPSQVNALGVDDAVSLGIGFTPAGTLADICTAVTGTDCITGETVGGFWRVAGIIPLVSEARKSGRLVDAVLDVTGKVHGALPRAADLSRYAVEELTRLRGDLMISVQTRIGKTVELGADYGHNARLAEEQQLLKSLEKHLDDR